MKRAKRRLSPGWIDGGGVVYAMVAHPTYERELRKSAGLPYRHLRRGELVTINSMPTRQMLGLA